MEKPFYPLLPTFLNYNFIATFSLLVDMRLLQRISTCNLKYFYIKPVLNVYKGNRLRTQNFLSCLMFQVFFWVPNWMIWRKDGILVSIRIIFLACKLKTSKKWVLKQIRKLSLFLLHSYYRHGGIKYSCNHIIQEEQESLWKSKERENIWLISSSILVEIEEKIDFFILDLINLSKNTTATYRWSDWSVDQGWSNTDYLWI